MEGGLYELDAADSPVVAEDMSDAEAAWAVGLAKLQHTMSISDRGISHPYNPLSYILHVTM